MTRHILTLEVPADWQAHLDRWETSLRVAGKAKRTVSTRLNHVRQMARAMRVSRPEDVTKEQLFDWCASRQWAQETRHAYYTSFGQFFAFACGDNSPAKSLPTVHRIPKQSRPTPDLVIEEAMAGADGRLRMIFRLARQVGLRAKEISVVHRRHIHSDLVGHSLEIEGKGGKVRHVPLDAGLAASLISLTEKNGGFAFPGQVDGHLSEHRISTIAGQALPDPWTLHSLRHRFANQAFASSMDIVAVQELMGHSSLETTRRYLVANQESLRIAASGAQMSLMAGRNNWQLSMGGVHFHFTALPLTLKINDDPTPVRSDDLANLAAVINQVLHHAAESTRRTI